MISISLASEKTTKQTWDMASAVGLCHANVHVNDMMKLRDHHRIRFISETIESIVEVGFSIKVRDVCSRRI